MSWGRLLLGRFWGREGGVLGFRGGKRIGCGRGGLEGGREGSSLLLHLGREV